MTGFTLSVSIVCFHSPRGQVLGLLDSLAVACGRARAELPLAAVEITIIDNSAVARADPGDFSAADCAELAGSPRLRGCELKMLRGHGNIGYGAGHNLAIRAASADYHLLLNPDVEFDPGAILAGLKFLLENAEVALVSPAAENNVGKQYLCKRYPSVLTLLLRGFGSPLLRRPFAAKLAAYEMRELPLDRPSKDIPIASGCCLLARAGPLREIGGFDAGYFLYFEDFDLSLRLGSRGKIAHVPAMRICHAGGKAAEKGTRHIAMFARSAWRFFNRHGWKWL